MFRGGLRASRPPPRWFLRATFLAWPSGFIAVLTGWLTAEVGRQPWVIFGAMRTAEAVTPSLSSNVAMISLVSYFLVYTLIFSAGTLYLYRLFREGPLDSDGSQAGPRSGGAAATTQSATRRGITPGRPLAVGGPSPAGNPAATQQAGLPAMPIARIHRKPGIDGGAA